MPVRKYNLKDPAEAAISKFTNNAFEAWEDPSRKHTVNRDVVSYTTEKNGRVVAEYIITSMTHAGQTHIMMDYRNSDDKMFISYNPSGPAEVLLDDQKNVIAEIFSGTPKQHKRRGLVA